MEIPHHPVKDSKQKIEPVKPGASGSYGDQDFSLCLETAKIHTVQGIHCTSTPIRNKGRERAIRILGQRRLAVPQAAR